MEKGVLEEAIKVVERATDRLIMELSSLFAVGKNLSPTERIAKAEYFLAVASNILRLEEKILSLREATEDAEEKKEFFQRAMEGKRPSLPPRAAKKWRG